MWSRNMKRLMNASEHEKLVTPRKIDSITPPMLLPIAWHLARLAMITAHALAARINWDAPLWISIHGYPFDDD